MNLIKLVSSAVCLAFLPTLSQVRTTGSVVPNPVRKADAPRAKSKTVIPFVLPPQYKDRVKFPLPAVFNLATKSPYFGPYDPSIPGLWAEQGMSCANAQVVGCLYNHEANRVRNFRTPSGSKSPEFSYQYTFHFLNNGSMQGGDFWMSYEVMDILKETGAASTVDFGGLEWGNSFLGWMSGYEKYYRAMKLRLNDYYEIDASAAGSEEAIKQVLVDYADGSEFGTGLVTHVSFSTGITKTTVEGRSVYAAYQAGGGHALSIVGFDDAFLADKGGSWILHDVHANGLAYSPRNLWKASGTLYYPNLGVPVLFPRIKANYTPKLTFKISLTHNQRGNIAVMTGVGPATGTGPVAWKDYAGAFNYSGGALPMVGKSQASTLEFGLDMTDFAAYLTTPNQKIYLMVLSKGGVGTIDKVSLMDYTGTEVKEIPAAETAKPIAPGTASTPVTTQIAITWPGTLGPVSILGKGNDRPMNAAWRKGGSVRVRLTAAGASMATLNIRDAGGRSIFGSRTNLNALSVGSSIELPWQMRNQGGQRVAPGLYFASVDLLHGGQVVQSAATPIQVDE